MSAANKDSILLLQSQFNANTNEVVRYAAAQALAAIAAQPVGQTNTTSQP